MRNSYSPDLVTLDCSMPCSSPKRFNCSEIRLGCHSHVKSMTSTLASTLVGFLSASKGSTSRQAPSKLSRTITKPFGFVGRLVGDGDSGERRGCVGKVLVPWCTLVEKSTDGDGRSSESDAGDTGFVLRFPPSTFLFAFSDLALAALGCLPMSCRS